VQRATIGLTDLLPSIGLVNMKTVVNKVTGKEICAIPDGFKYQLSSVEVIVPYVRKDEMLDPYFDFSKNEFFDKKEKIPPYNFTKVNPIQLRLSLDYFNLLDPVEAALNMPENKVHKIAFEYALSFDRNDEMINGFAQAFGLSESQVDNIFKYAESIQQ